MTSDDFANIAVSMPDARESAHAAHREFSIGGEVFATLGYPSDGFGMLELSPDERIVVMAAAPSIFTRATGPPVRSGGTLVRLGNSDAVKDALARRAMELAYEAALLRSKTIDGRHRTRRD